MSYLAPDYTDDDGVIVSVRKGRSRIRVPVPISELPSRTKQADAQGADINYIVGRYKKTGELPVSRRAALFDDLTAVDLKDALDVLTSAQQSFALLPSKVRSAFNNDPEQLLAALDRSKDPLVHDQLYRAGVLAEPYKAPAAPPDEGPKQPDSSGGTA